MTERKLKFWGQSYLVRTDIEPFSTYIDNEFTPYLSESSIVDTEINVLLEKGPKEAIHLNRPRPESSIRVDGNKITVNYKPNLLAKLRYGCSPVEHPGVLAWLTYIVILFPLFSRYEKDGYVPVHGGLVRCDGRTILVVGRGGSGKSSLITMLLGGQNASFGGDNFVLLNPETQMVLPLVTAIHLEKKNPVHVEEIRSVGRTGDISRNIVRVVPKNVFTTPEHIDKIIILGESAKLNAQVLLNVMNNESILAAYREWFTKLNGNRLPRQMGEKDIAGLLNLAEGLPALRDMREHQLEEIVNRLNKKTW
ncbi:MAG: hypothetical protein UX31_C0004G0005 [Candidatus Nomurabacteria bacterium GW2011_GWA1_46_11]|uniref:HPr kinase/phosphorylase C-terminal domain-containing protein n=2 Tax=Parcubacteria group TaxID=1794811 RepID=A0A1G1YXA7_9BACT|nr:MAG: hypothetical protein UX29_C0003G0019 [Parcubacteria group bacterium GW2011_GWA2_46_10]KKU22276.1 MAG: hypothetical protein UX31_C0004G0005 [Candidatus Nomurabacteria bacterium GW2011_GWA1_46_11]OGY56426.1 MAG: hypothetical protein A2119_02190 [Candidatus Colwellbacteria bacterium GWA2_46_10]